MRICKKDWAITVILLLLALVLTCRKTPDITILGEPSSVIGEMTSDMPVRQAISVKGGRINQIDLVFGTYVRNNTSQLLLRLVDGDGKVYAQDEISCMTLVDNSAYSWKIGTVTLPFNKEVFLEAVSLGEPGNTVTLYYDPTQTGEFYVGDIAYNGQLAISLYAPEKIETVFSYGLHPLRAVLIVVVTYLFLFLASKRWKDSSAIRCMWMITPGVLIIFFAIPPIITYDSAHYLNYIPILSGEVGFEEWDIVRGPVFPVILGISYALFGKSVQGVLTLELLFYETTLLCVLLLAEKMLYGKRFAQRFMWIIAIGFICNPIFMGGFHALLTEFPAAFFTILSCVIAWKWLGETGDLKKRDLAYILYFIIVSVLLWQLKQPYMGCVVYPLVAVLLYTFIVHDTRSIKRAIIRCIMPVVCIVSMLLSTVIWTDFIDSFGKMDETRTTSAMTSQLVVGSLPLENLGEFSGRRIQEKFSLTGKQEKNLSVTEPETLYTVYRLDDNSSERQSENVILIPQNEKMSVLSSINIFAKCWLKFPKETAKSYTFKYLKLCNVYDNQHLFHSGAGDENASIYYRILTDEDNVFYVKDYLQAAVEPVHCQYKTPSILRVILRLNELFYTDALFKCLMGLTPLIWLIVLCQTIYYRKFIQIKKLNVLKLIIWTYCVGNLLFHTLFAGAIDRYLFTNFFVAWAALIIGIGEIFQKANLQKYQEYDIFYQKE